MSERPKPNFPPDEIAPTLALLRGEGDPTLHYSALTPDTHASVSLKTWSRLYYQMQALNEWDQCQVAAELADVDITMNFPDYGEYDERGPVTTVSLSCTHNLADEHGVYGRTGFIIDLDLAAPGYMKVVEVMIGDPDRVTTQPRFNRGARIAEPIAQLYMTSSGGSVIYTAAEHVLAQEDAEAMVDLLSSARFSTHEKLEQRFNAGMELMNPALREACHRYFVLRKTLYTDPESILLEPTWNWGHMPSQINGETTSLGVIYESNERLIVYAPPGSVPCDAADAVKLYHEYGPTSSKWIKAVWESDELRDDYDPYFTNPTSLEAVELHDFIAEAPSETRHSVAIMLMSHMYARRNWVLQRKSAAESIAGMTEAEFVERKRQFREEGIHFFWRDMKSWDSCLKQVTVEGGLQGEIEYYEQLEALHTQVLMTFEINFPDMIPLLGEESKIWNNDAQKQAFLLTLKGLHDQRVARRPNLDM